VSCRSVSTRRAHSARLTGGLDAQSRDPLERRSGPVEEGPVAIVRQQEVMHLSGEL